MYMIQVLPLAALLWLHFYPPKVKVIIFLITSKGEDENKVRKYYRVLRKISKGSKIPLKVFKSLALAQKGFSFFRSRR